MKPKPTITVLIPAYNEEENIEKCIRSVLEQEQETYILEKILVVSDGSTDGTVNLVASIDSHLIKSIEWDANRGIGAVVDYAFQNTHSDFLFKLDGDLTLNSTRAIENTLDQRSKTNADLFFVRQNYPEPSSSLLDRYIHRIHGYVYKKKLLPLLKGDQYLQTHIVGSYLLKKTLYKKITVPQNVITEDVYIFYTSQQQGFKTSYTSDPHVYFAYPESWSHHINQITRWDTSVLGDYFAGSFMRKYNAPLPLTKVVLILFRELFRNPTLICILVLTRSIAFLKKPFYIRTIKAFRSR